MGIEKYERDNEIESDLDDDLDEESRRKKKEARLVKQFLTMKYEEERKAFIEKYGYRMGLSVGSYAEKVYQNIAKRERTITEIVSDFEILDMDDFSDFIYDGESDSDELKASDDVANKEKKAVNTVVDASAINRSASKSANPAGNRAQASAAAAVIIDNITLRYAKELLAGDKKDIALKDMGGVTRTLLTLQPSNRDFLKSGLWTLLDVSDLSRLAMTEDLMKKIKIKLDDDQKRIASMKIDGIELISGGETAESVNVSKDNTNLYRIKDIISKNYYEKNNFAGLVGAKMFAPEEGRIDALNEALAEDLTVTIPDILDKNTHFYKSSKLYRDMQKAVTRFIENHENPDFSELDEAESSKKIKDDLEQVTNAVKKYLDGKGGIDSLQPYKDEYERKRVYAAREVYRILVNKRQQMDAYCKYQEYASTLKDINEGTAYHGSSKYAARRILDIGYEKGKLDSEQSKMLQKSFDTLCLDRLKIVLDLEKQPEDKRLTDEQLLEQIHSSDMYKKYFENPEKLSAKFAKKIIDDRLENDIVKSIIDEQPEKEATSEKSGNSKVKQTKVKPSGGVKKQSADIKQPQGQRVGP